MTLFAPGSGAGNLSEKTSAFSSVADNYCGTPSSTRNSGMPGILKDYSRANIHESHP